MLVGMRHQLCAIGAAVVLVATAPLLCAQGMGVALIEVGGPALAASISNEHAPKVPEFMGELQRSVGFDFKIQGFNGGDYNTAVGNNQPLLPTEGVLIANVREHSRDGLNGIIDVPGPIVRPPGNDANGGFWLAPAVAGGDGTNPEMNVNLSVAWFSFAAGWHGGLGSGGGALLAGTPGLGTGTVSRVGTGRYDVSIPGQNSRNSGMLFVVGASNADHAVTAGVSDTNDAWRVGVRDNQGSLASGLDEPFRFVFVSYVAENLIGGRIGGDGSKIRSAGDFTLVRDGVGVYRLTVPGESPNTGSLILTTAGMIGDHPDDNILVYEGEDDSDDFIIQARDLDTPLDLEDTEFVFAFVSFANPLGFAIPEPASVGVILAGVCGLLGVRRRAV